MIRLHWPQLFREHRDRRLAEEVAARTYELSQYLVDVLGVTAIGTPGDAPRRLPRLVPHAPRAAAPRPAAPAARGRRELVEMPRADRCCGFGGTFRSATPRCRPRWPTTSWPQIAAAGVDVAVSADPGCAAADRRAPQRTGARRARRPSGIVLARGAVSLHARAHERLGRPPTGARPSPPDRSPVRRTGRRAGRAGRLRSSPRPRRRRFATLVHNLPRYLDRSVADLEGRGVIVHRAATAAEAVRSSVTSRARHGGGPVVKGKSMAVEEIGLNERLEADGVEVFETDLGEFILQLAGERPEHILAPAIHWSRDRVRRAVRAARRAVAGRSIRRSSSDLPAATCARGSSRPASASPA